MIQYEILENSNEIFKIKLINNVSFANNLRRKIHNTAGYAIQTVEILKNTTFIPNEFISHRLCQLPVLKQQSYSTDIDFTAEEDGWLISDKIEGVHQGCFLFNMVKGQKLKLSLRIEKGKVEEDIRWGLGFAFFRIEEDSIIFTTESFGQIKAENLFKINI